MKRAIKFIAILIVVLVVVATVSFFGLESYLVRTHLAPVIEHNASARATHRAAVLADIDALAAHPVMQPRAGVDGSARMNALLSWRKGRKGELHLDDDVRALANKPIAALTDAERDQVRALDFTWLADARRFNRWSLYEESPIANDPAYDLIQGTRPELADLAAWARLRTLRGALDDDDARAREDVEHIVFLLMSTEDLLAQLIGASILKPLDPDATERIVRLGFGARAFVLPFVEPEARDALLAKLARSPLMCSTLNEVHIDYIIKPSIEGRYPEFFAAMAERTARKSHCRLEALKLAQAQAARDPWGRLRASDVKTTGYDLPVARRLAGVVLLSISTQDFLKRYARP